MALLSNDVADTEELSAEAPAAVTANKKAATRSVRIDLCTFLVLSPHACSPAFPSSVLIN
jgi:hypothetical protein